MSAITDDDADHLAEVGGIFYTDLLRTLHADLVPQSYLEVGTMAGDTLGLASCSSIAVDPHFIVSKDVIGNKSCCLFFQETSDVFFASHDPTALFGRSVDLAFLDGLHLFEFLLRDFINTERHCSSDSVVVMHDCLPPGFFMTVRDPNDPIRRRSRYRDWWTGDVWKIVPTLAKYRPELEVRVLDCAPTGLVVVSGLDPSSATLARHYDEIVQQSAGLEMDRAAYDAYWHSIQIVRSREFVSPPGARR